MLDTSYIQIQYGAVNSILDIKQIQEFDKIKRLYDWLVKCSVRVMIHISVEGSIYQFSCVKNKNIIGTFYYIPDNKRIDGWIGNSPFIQIVKGKIIWSSYPELFVLMGFNDCFKKLQLITLQ